MSQTNEKSRFVKTLQKGGDEQRSNTTLIRHLWGGAGIICFSLGAIGAVLPLIPTTPFILLAALCFARSSKKLDQWFRQTKLYKTVFEGLLTRRAMTVSAKLKLLIPIACLLGISFALLGDFLPGRILVASILIGHIVYFGFVVKTEKPAPRESAFTSSQPVFLRQDIAED